MNNLACQLLDSIEYRFNTAVLESQPEFANFSPGNGSRTPLEIVSHLVNVMAKAEATLTEREAVAWRTNNLEAGVNQFRFILHQLKDFIEDNEVDSELLEILIHGPISDVFGHIGQLVLMRVMSGKPMKRINYMKAPVNLRLDIYQPAERVSG
ncbi:MAG: hypothetical protein GC180_05655 [Bacteroidetes bacterium]|nr:hypothetical protein [Bacteroidota bacterium]